MGMSWTKNQEIWYVWVCLKMGFARQLSISMGKTMITMMTSFWENDHAILSQKNQIAHHLHLRMSHRQCFLQI